MQLNKLQTEFIADIKQKVRQAQYEALKAVNTQLINLYWELGKAIAEKQALGWGKAIVPTLSKRIAKRISRNNGIFGRESLANVSVLY